MCTPLQPVIYPSSTYNSSCDTMVGIAMHWNYMMFEFRLRAHSYVLVVCAVYTL